MKSQHLIHPKIRFKLWVGNWGLTRKYTHLYYVYLHDMGLVTPLYPGYMLGLISKLADNKWLAQDFNNTEKQFSTKEEAANFLFSMNFVEQL